MLSILRRFTASSIPITQPRPAFDPELGFIRENERIVDFFGTRIIFPDWNPDAEAEIREQLTQIRGLTDEGMADKARALILDYLDRDNPRYWVHANGREALKAISDHTRKVVRAKGLVCEM